jgi:hypothetical protein
MKRLIIKRFVLVLALTVLFTAPLFAQAMKDMPSERIENSQQQMFGQPQQGFFGSLLGSAFDENHFRMNHSYSLAYNSFVGATTGEYVNTMIYKFDAPVMLRADIGVMHQPFGASQQQIQTGFGQNAFTGIYLKNAQLIWQPKKDMTFSIQFMQIPQGQFFNPMMNPMGGGFGRPSMWGW